MPDTCRISFDLAESRLIISASSSSSYAPVVMVRGDDSVEQINQLTSMYRALVAMRSFASENDAGVISFARNLGTRIYALFFEGLQDLLTDCSNIAIEHSRFLLPLELAFDGEDFIGLKYCIGNSVRSSRLKLTSERRQRVPPRLSPAFRIMFLGKENDTVSKVVSDEVKFSLCESLRSTWSENLLDRLQSTKYDVLHLACHGQFNERDPEQSFFILDQERFGQGRSACLTVNQIEHVNLSPTFLVFLNACHTGRVDENDLGFVGFADSLLQSGADSCITTLWSISEQGATYFASAFYQYLFRGESLGEALREARTRCWQDKKDVLTSLSYVLFGDPSKTIRLPQEDPRSLTVEDTAAHEDEISAGKANGNEYE